MTEFDLHTKVDLENGNPAFAKPVLAAAAVDLSRIKDGTKVLIDIIDELPDGDGSSIYKGIATVWRIRDGFIDFHDLDLIGKVSEIKRVYYRKSVSSCS
jgi:hypothetical protein